MNKDLGEFLRKSERCLKFKGSPEHKFIGSIRKRVIELGEFKLDQFIRMAIKNEFPSIGSTSSKRTLFCTKFGYQFLCYLYFAFIQFFTHLNCHTSFSNIVFGILSSIKQIFNGHQRKRPVLFGCVLGSYSIQN